MDDVGFFGKVIGDALGFVPNPENAVECASAGATAVGVVDKLPIPPATADAIEEVVDIAVGEGGGEDFTVLRVVNDESGGGAGLESAVRGGVDKARDVFEPMELEFVFVEGF